MYKISFNYNDNRVDFESNKANNLYSQVLNWLYDNGYNFTGIIHNQFIRKPHSLEEIYKVLERGYSIDDFIQIKDQDIYFFRCGNIDKIYPNIVLMLKEFGIDTNQIKSQGLDSKRKITPLIDFNPSNTTETNQYYLIGAYSKDKTDWWRQFVEEGKWYNGFALGGDSRLDDKVNEIPVGANVAIKSTYTKERTKPAMMVKARGVVTKNYGDGTKLDVEWEPDFKPFEMVRNDLGGYRATLHLVTNQEHIDLIWNLDGKDDGEEKDVMSPYDFFTSTTGGSKSIYTMKDEPSLTMVKPDKYDITLTRDPQKSNKIEKLSSFTGHKTNPFRQAICVLGKSGMGKSTTIEKVLKSLKDNMEYEYIIPTASTTNLLAQYSPGSNRYIQSRLGKLIMKAQKNPEKLFTAVFDECHKANVIEMINDELLQAISIYRNLTKRFISVDDDTAELYDGLDRDNSGNLLIPNNFGFIFLSSKPNIIIDNEDFFNRVDIYVLKRQPLETATDLNLSTMSSKVELNPKYFESIGDKKTGSKTAADVDLIKELHK